MALFVIAQFIVVFLAIISALLMHALLSFTGLGEDSTRFWPLLSAIRALSLCYTV
jgi:hypothetical protein